MNKNARRQSFARWIKFNLVGGIGVAIQLSALWTLTSLKLGYIPATVLAVEAAVLQNFLWHERFTWVDRRSSAKHQIAFRLLRFNLTTGLVSITGNGLLMDWLVGEAHLPIVGANLISITLCSLANFLISDRWVFRQASS